jgi:hypothetical protein
VETFGVALRLSNLAPETRIYTSPKGARDVNAVRLCIALLLLMDYDITFA